MGRRVVALLGLTVALTACNPPVSSPSATAIPHGGTLRVVITLPVSLTSGGYMPPDKTTLDLLQPSAPGLDTTELLRCCLGRTLMSYNGQPTVRGGADLRPDLAAAAPSVSADGLSWTFHLRPGLHYAPPLQQTEITAGDFVRALQRAARVGGSTEPFYEDIVGFGAFQQGQTQSISGLQTPDSHTLVINLNKAEGDLGYRMSIPAAAPIPPRPADAAAPFGVATGHDDGDSGFIVSSGPYMLEGARQLDFTKPAAQQQAASGLNFGTSLTFVRNPSWSAADDQLRAAYADRIVITYAANAGDAVAAVDAGRADLILAVTPPPQVPVGVIHAYEADPNKGRVDIQPRDGVRYISMNLARPPFDDVHVRRAVAFILDRAAIQAAFGGDVSGAVTEHVALDSMEDGALLNYNPYRTPDAAARLRAAQQEMAQSAYDSAHKGICDAPQCANITAIALKIPQIPPAMADIVRENVAQIGLQLDVMQQPGMPFFQRAGDPKQDPAMALFWAYFKDYPSGSGFFASVFSNDAIAAGSNLSLVGATADQLHGWGYGVTSVPSVDDRISACLPLVGQAQTQCWTSLDQFMTEKVVSAIPFVAESYVEVIPRRIVAYSFDQFAALPALDRIAIAH